MRERTEALGEEKKTNLSEVNTTVSAKLACGCACTAGESSQKAAPCCLRAAGLSSYCARMLLEPKHVY